jgi:hypothetical protein
MCDMVTLGGKNNRLEPGKHNFTFMSSALDLLTPFLPWAVYKHDMMTLDGKDNGIGPKNRVTSALDILPFDLKIYREHFIRKTAPFSRFLRHSWGYVWRIYSNLG